MYLSKIYFPIRPKQVTACSSIQNKHHQADFRHDLIYIVPKCIYRSSGRPYSDHGIPKYRMKEGGHGPGSVELSVATLRVTFRCCDVQMSFRTGGSLAKLAIPRLCLLGLSRSA